MTKATLEQIIESLRFAPGCFAVYGKSDGALIPLYTSSTLADLVALPREEVTKNLDLFSLVFKDDYDLTYQRALSFIQSDSSEGEAFTFRMSNRKSGFVWVHVTAEKLALVDGSIVTVVALVDVTGEMDNSKAILDASDQYVCVVDKNSKRMLYANDAFYAMAGTSIEEARGKYCFEVLCGDPTQDCNEKCLCFSSVNADPPVEYFNPISQAYITLTGREITWGDHPAYVFYLNDITKEKLMDEKLRDAQQRFDVALDNSDLMIWEYDIVNGLCINSAKAGRGYDIPLIIENYPEALYETGHVPPETIEQIKQVKQRLLNGETGFSVERRTVNKFGESEWQKVSYSLQTDADGKPLRAIVCGLDITKQKELEYKFHEQLAYRDNLAENALFSVCIDFDDDRLVDYTTGHLKINELASNATSASEFLKELFETAVFPADSGITHQKLEAASLRTAFDMGISQYHTMYLSSRLNKYLNLSANVYRNPTTSHVEVFIVIDDITDDVITRNALEKMVLESYDSLGLIDIAASEVRTLSSSTGTNSMPTPAVGKKGEPYDIVCARLMDGKTFVDENGKTLDKSDFALDKIKKQVDATGKCVRTLTITTTDGTIYTHRVSYRYADDSKLAMIYAQSDLSDLVAEEQRKREELEAALNAAKKADIAKTEFLSRMSHDMRTPMNGIIGMTALTQAVPGLPDEAKGNLASIADSSNYLLQLINDTLDMNKISSGRLALNNEVINSGELIRHIIRTITPLAEAKNISLTFHSSNTKLGYIRSDRVRVHQLFLNVLSNAVKFTPEGGTIEMSVDVLKRENGLVHDRICIKDSGCGMSPEFLEHLFEPFTQEITDYSREQQGTGLGMAIVKQLVDLMGGTVEVESEQGKGTTVTAYIDFETIDDDEAQGQAEEKPKEQVDLTGKRVLLAEDNKTNALIAERLLQQKGMEVTHAFDGKLALDLFAASPENYFDYVLLDIRMPVMDGLETARAIRALERPDATLVPIIALSANAYAEDVQASLDAGMNDHVAKPFNVDDLYGSLQKLAR